MRLYAVSLNDGVSIESTITGLLGISRNLGYTATTGQSELRTRTEAETSQFVEKYFNIIMTAIAMNSFCKQFDHKPVLTGIHPEMINNAIKTIKCI